ncbi:MAG: hypothetical protein AAF916_08035 [Planctomycetota bacterium]
MRRINRQTARSPDRHIRRSRGFTLIEAALTTVIVGTGVLALVGAQQAYHIKNDYAVRTNQGHMLANEIRELTANLPHHDPITSAANYGPEPGEGAVLDYDDLDDFAGTVSAGFGAGLTFNPPINAAGLTMTGLDQWTQQVSVSNVDPANISVATGSTLPIGTTDVMRVTVTVFYDQDQDGNNLQRVSTMTWAVPEAD